MIRNENRIKDLFELYCSARKAAPKDYASIATRLAEIRNEIMQSSDSFEYEAYPLYAQLIALYVPLGPSTLSLGAMASKADAFADIGPELGGIPAKKPAGVSLVTCSKNRTENLIKALPSWLRHSSISEVLIVDWGSDIPIEGPLRDAGFDDERIRIVRVENEPRWILSYAFNIGFRAASFDTILKADADIVLSEDFFGQNRLAPGSFIAGNWRKAADNQAYVNGFFMLPVRALHDTNGFNEFITTYGWDDDDIYDRLMLAGYRRQDVVPDTVFHLPHSDDERLGKAEAFRARRPTMLEKLTDGTPLLIHTNRVLTGVMPRWGTTQHLLPFVNESVKGHVLTIRRQGWVPSVVPAHTLVMARDHALTDMLSWNLGTRVRNLMPDVLHRILARPADELSRIDVEVGLVAPRHLLRGPGRYLVFDITDTTLLSGEKSAALAGVVRSLAARRAMRPVLRAQVTALPATADESLRALPLVPAWENIGVVQTVPLSALQNGADIPEGDVMLKVDAKVLAAPNIASRRKRLFIDCQHGLGNRMRAMGSAAAIADATDRELVIVWEPDHHCDGKFSDLFDYKGTVIGRCFAEDAREQGLQVYNYMPMEPGSEKSVPIDTDLDKDIYARAAFVLENPHSTWGRENHFIQELTPVEAVRALVNSVRHPNDISAHVRMEAGAGLDHNTYDRPENWGEEDHKLIHEWRAKSHFSHFMTRIDALLAELGISSLFLAADLPETYNEFQERYGERLAWLPRTLYDRSSEQLHYALADAILLSRAPLMLGSTWSSFSELAMRLAPNGIKVEMSGKDF